MKRSDPNYGAPWSVFVRIAVEPKHGEDETVFDDATTVIHRGAEEGWTARQVAAAFLRQMADEIESGEMTAGPLRPT
jgi:hypothetical protein